MRSFGAILIVIVVVIVVIVIGCANGQTPDASKPVVATATTANASANPTANAASPSVVGAGRVHVEVPLPGNVAIVNDTDAAVSIQWDLLIERDSSGTWKQAHAMTMMQKCVEAPPTGKCVVVAAHATYKPLPWTGWFGCTQSGICRANSPAVAGRYRAVALECGSGARFEGPAMTLVEDGRFAKTPHVYASSNEPNAIVIDNEADDPASFRVAVDVAKLDPARNAYDTVEHAGMLLSSGCFPDAGTCVTVPAHGTLRALAFMPGCGRCMKCPQQSIKPGTYTSTVQLCDGAKPMYNDVYGSTWRTAPFVVDAQGTARAER
jgi:hypothetical protein